MDINPQNRFPNVIRLGIFLMIICNIMMVIIYLNNIVKILNYLQYYECNCLSPAIDTYNEKVLYWD